MTTIVTGLYNCPSAAATAVHLLETEGVPPDDISLVAGDGFSKESFAVDTHTKVPEGIAVGAATGGAAGALLAGLTTVGAVASGGLGLVVAGPLIAALAGAGAGAAAGGVLGGLVGAAIPEHEVKYYEDAIKKGAVMIGVKCDGGDEKDVAKKVLKESGAIKVSHA